MNNFLGIGIILYITIFNYKSEAVLPDEYAKLSHWINFQVLYLYVQLGVAVLMFLCMNSMQKKVIRKQDDSKDEKPEGGIKAE